MKGQFGVCHEEPVSWEDRRTLEQGRVKERLLGWLRVRIRVDDYGIEGITALCSLPHTC